MRYAAYPDSDTTGADWLGMLPKNWAYRRLRFVAVEPLMYGANEAAVLDDRDLPRYIRITDVKADGTLHDDTFRSLEEEVAAPFLLKDGDILLARSGATVGKSFQYLANWGRAAYAGYLIRFRPDQDVIFPRFANYYFQTSCYWACINSTLIQATIENFSAEKYKDLKLPLPPTDEQQQIAAFLDWKTGQIDALVAQKKELLEKLNEKRLAVITQAVTRGLNPAAPLRDSGIPWLGQVPKHWEVKRLRFLVNAIDQGWSPRASNVAAEGDELGVLKLSAVSRGRFVPEENKMLEEIPEDQAIHSPRKHDLLITRANTPELVGDACTVLQDYPQLIIPDLIYRLTVNLSQSEEAFVSYFLLSKQGRAQIEADARGSSGSMVKLGQGHLKNFQIPSPPVEEQKTISTFLDQQTGRIDSLMEKIHQAITCLTEYRTALITAATTGKIDVRKVKIPRRAA